MQWFLYSLLGFGIGMITGRLLQPRIIRPSGAIASSPKPDQLHQVQDLQQQSSRLQDDLHRQTQQIIADCRDTTFEQLQPLLTSYPTARQMAQIKPNLPAQNLLALFTSLENLLQHWRIEPIGTPWEAVPYDPQLHHPDASDLVPGDVVYIRFVGYRQDDRILCPAQVSRTLPPGVAP